MLQIHLGRPPNYQAIVAALGRPPINAVFTYGDRLYVQTPDQARMVGPILLSHEEVHREQQAGFSEARGTGSEAVLVGDGAAALWWELYLRDPKFRLKQEVEAYRAEYRFAREKILNRAKRRIVLNMLARHLSAPHYGGLVTTKAALELIR